MAEFSHYEIIQGVRQHFESQALEGLARAVSGARKKAGQRRSDYNIVYNELLRKYPNADKSGKKIKTRMFYQDAISGARAFLKNVAGRTVETAELKRREAICMKCPSMNAMAGCKAGCGMSQAAVNALDTASKALFGKARNDINPALRTKFCDVCGCALSVMLPAQIGDFPIDGPEKAGKRPKACWLTTENRALSE